MTQRKPQADRMVIPDEVKAAALADLVFLEPAAVAAKYGLKQATVRAWKSRELDDHLTELPTVATVKKNKISTLLLEALQANLNAQIAQAYVASDPDYIKRQPAGELAVLYGVLSDKSIRIVDAARALFASDDSARSANGELSDVAP